MYITEYDTGYMISVDKKDAYYSEALQVLQAYPGRQYIAAKESFLIPKNGFPSSQTIGEHLMSKIENMMLVKKFRTARVESLPPLETEIVLKKEMYPFQKQGVAYCLKHRQVLIGDQQGLGKTIQALAAVVAPGETPGLIITKNSLRFNWQKEIHDWTDLRPTIFSDSIKHTWPHLFSTGFFDVGIVNYDSLQKYFVKSIRIPPGESFRLHHIMFYEWIKIFKWIIIDESHYVKDMKTKRTKFTVGICKGKEQVYLLSGTPALNHPLEVYTQVCILNKHKYFGDRQTFEATFCGKKNKQNLPALNRLLTEHCYYRREKGEVAQDMPGKTRQIIVCDIDNREEYKKAVTDFRRYLKENMQKSDGQITSSMRAEALVQMMMLKHISARGKLSAAKDWMESMIDQDEKFVIFAEHKDVQKALYEMIPGRMLKLGGGLSADQVQDTVQKFNNDPKFNGLVCSIKADSEGHNLQIASNLATVELPWHYGKLEQMEDRIHRIGTKFPCTYYNFLGDQTIDQNIYDLIMDKKDMHDKITGSHDTVPTRVIDKIINLFTS